MKRVAEKPKLGSRTFGLSALRLTIVLGIALIAVGIAVGYSDSLPRGWTQVDGTVASSVGKRSGNKTLYYAVVQYQALGYSYEINDPQGTAYNPPPGTTMQVAFNPDQPSQAKLPSTLSLGYFKLLFPAVGLLVMTAGVYGYTAPQRRTRALAKAAAKEAALAEKLAAEEIMPIPEAPEAATAAVAIPATKPKKERSAKKKRLPLRAAARTRASQKLSAKATKAKPAKKKPAPKPQAVMLSRLRLGQ